MPELLRICPSCAEAWSDHCEFWDGERAGDYNDVAVIAHHIVASAREGATAEFSEVFAFVERVLEVGNEDARGLIAVGLIEDIQVIGSHDGLGYEQFRKWLGERTRQAWLEIEHQWEGVGSLADMIRKERSQGR